MVAKADDKSTGHTESLIAAGTIVAGDIFFTGGLRVDGEVRGNVRCPTGQPGTLVVGETGRVDGEVDVARLIVSGTVAGRIVAREFLRLQAKARVDCDVDYGAAEIHSGAVVQGRLTQRPVAELAACLQVLAAATA